MQEMIFFWPLKNFWYVADFRMMRKWKLLLVDGYECKILVATAREFVNSFQNERNASVESERGFCWTVMIFQWDALATLDVLMTFFLFSWPSEPYVLNIARIGRTSEGDMYGIDTWDIFEWPQVPQNLLYSELTYRPLIFVQSVRLRGS